MSNNIPQHRDNNENSTNNGVPHSQKETEKSISHIQKTVEHKVEKHIPNSQNENQQKIKHTTKKHKPSKRLFFHYLQLFIGVCLIAYPLLFSISVQNFIATLLDGSASSNFITKAIIAGCCIALYFNLRAIFTNHHDMAKLMKVEHIVQTQESTSFQQLLETLRYSNIGKLLREYHDCTSKKEIEGDPARDFIDILSEKEATNQRMMNYLTNSMPMLGLIGTLIGLSQSMEGLQDVVNSSDDTANIFFGLKVALTGINTAFYTTLLGLIALLILKYFNMISRQARAIVLSDVYKLLRFYIP